VFFLTLKEEARAIFFFVSWVQILVRLLPFLGWSLSFFDGMQKIGRRQDLIAISSFPLSSGSLLGDFFFNCGETPLLSFFRDLVGFCFKIFEGIFF